MTSIINWLKDFLIPSYMSWKNDKWFLMFTWAMVAFFVALALWLLLSAMDSLLLPIRSGDGLIISTRFIPSHYDTEFIYNTAIPDTTIATPVTTYHPDAWSWIIKINGHFDNVNVSEENYLLRKAGQIVHCTYSKGRLWGTLYIKTVSL